MKNRNPFIITGYVSSKYFCDREKETIKIIDAFKNSRNLTLFSFRRMGKTGLIYHAFNRLSNIKNSSTFYIDIQDTTNLAGFTDVFAKAVIGQFDKLSTKFLESIGKIFSSLRPSISYDSLTGQPNINLEIKTAEDATKSLEQIFDYLEKQNKQILIAIDEFQQILNYPEKNIEALLRKHIQKTKNINFIFSCSHKHMLISMFRDHSRPFYQSSELMDLGPIESEEYKKFINKNFLDGGKNINESDVDFILDWTRKHTFYVQYVCNRLYSLEFDELTKEVIQKTMNEILLENRAVFNNYKNLLTSNQWKLLQAIAGEEKVKQITSAKFIEKYKLGSASSVSSALKVLVDNEMVYQSDDFYLVNDVFLSRWLENRLRN